MPPVVLLLNTLAPPLTAGGVVTTSPLPHAATFPLDFSAIEYVLPAATSMHVPSVVGTVAWPSVKRHHTRTSPAVESPTTWWVRTLTFFMAGRLAGVE